jgi:hypothetical protein
VGFHISLDLVVFVGTSVVGIAVVCVGAGVGVDCYMFDIMFFAAYFALFGSLRAT